MSDSFDPQDLDIRSSFIRNGSVTRGIDNEDTYKFTLPDENTVSAGRQFNKLQPLGYILNNGISLPSADRNLELSFGSDDNDSGFFDRPGEEIAGDTIDTTGSRNELDVFDASKSLEDNLLDFGQTYFAEIESLDTLPDGTQTNYTLSAEAVPVFEGEINENEDTSYNYNGGRYYYDQLDELSFKVGDPVIGDTTGATYSDTEDYVLIVLSETSLDPLLFIIS